MLAHAARWREDKFRVRLLRDHRLAFHSGAYIHDKALQTGYVVLGQIVT
jgi:hypothetical protein